MFWKFLFCSAVCRTGFAALAFPAGIFGQAGVGLYCWIDLHVTALSISQLDFACSCWYMAHERRKTCTETQAANTLNNQNQANYVDLLNCSFSMEMKKEEAKRKKNGCIYLGKISCGHADVGHAAGAAWHWLTIPLVGTNKRWPLVCHAGYDWKSYWYQTIPDKVSIPRTQNCLWYATTETAWYWQQSLPRKWCRKISEKHQWVFLQNVMCRETALPCITNGYCKGISRPVEWYWSQTRLISDSYR